MKKTNCRLIVFAKAPVPGEVKTRLLPSLSAAAAAALYEQLVLHCLKTAVDTRVGPIDLWCTPSTGHPFFSRCAKEFHLELHRQIEGDLGSRMRHAFDETLKISTYALLMGTDCPCLTCADLKEAETALEKGVDAVIAPTEDGGYVLIGLHHLAPGLFTGISWGTWSVLEETRIRLQKLGWRWRELHQCWDVDRPEDVERLMLEGYLKRWGFG